MTNEINFLQAPLLEKQHLSCTHNNFNKQASSINLWTAAKPLFSSTFSINDTSKWIIWSISIWGNVNTQLQNKSPLMLNKCQHDDTTSQNSHEKEKINVQIIWHMLLFIVYILSQTQWNILSIKIRNKKKTKN